MLAVFSSLLSVSAFVVSEGQTQCEAKPEPMCLKIGQWTKTEDNSKQLISKGLLLLNLCSFLSCVLYFSVINVSEWWIQSDQSNKYCQIKRNNWDLAENKRTAWALIWLRFSPCNDGYTSVLSLPNIIFIYYYFCLHIVSLLCDFQTYRIKPWGRDRGETWQGKVECGSTFGTLSNQEPTIIINLRQSVSFLFHMKGWLLWSQFPNYLLHA